MKAHAFPEFKTLQVRLRPGLCAMGRNGHGDAAPDQELITPQLSRGNALVK